ncbi:YwqH-like family protein [Halobacillus faecis]
MESLFYYNQLYDQKQDELRRLREAASRLQGFREELARQKKVCMEPELSPATWSGQLAGEFENIRMNGLLTQYRSIEGEQLMNALDAIQSKISGLQFDLYHYNQKITSLRYEMTLAEKK